MDQPVAKSMSHHLLARYWAQQETLSLRLPTRYVAITPGATLRLPRRAGSWTVTRCTIKAFVAVVELRPTVAPFASAFTQAAAMTTMSSARIVDTPATEALVLALFDVPLQAETGHDQPAVYLAASSASDEWRNGRVEIRTGALSLMTRMPRRKTILGRTATTLAAGRSHLIDAAASVDVVLVDPEQWLVSCDDDALVGGCNLAIVGRELIQFGGARALGGGRFRLSRLLRGRGGTEWAGSDHRSGEMFAMVALDQLQRVPLPDWTRGGEVVAEHSRNGLSASARARSPRKDRGRRRRYIFVRAWILPADWCLRGYAGAVAAGRGSMTSTPRWASGKSATACASWGLAERWSGNAHPRGCMFRHPNLPCLGLGH
jgi:hypothetical protein